MREEFNVSYYPYSVGWAITNQCNLNCKHCNACLAKCPQHLNIPEYLKEITSFYNK